MKHTAVFFFASLCFELCIGQATMLGGYKHHKDHQNDARVQEVAQFAVQKIGEATNAKLELVKIHSVQTQVVAGKNYKLFIDTATEAQKLQPYEAVVYEPLGGQELQLTEHKAVSKPDVELQSEMSSERHSGALVGGFKEVDTSESDVQDAGKFAAEQISQQSNSLVPFELKEIASARSKTDHDGKVYSLDLKLAQGSQEKIYKAEVHRSLKNSYTLQSTSAQ